ncbi:MAG TPA: hypothetical protein VF147_05015 [Vicinamibacterales bacterium]
MDLSEVAAKETSALVQHLERNLAELTKRLAAAAAQERDAAVDRVTTDRDAVVARVTAECDATVKRVTAESDTTVKRVTAECDAAVKSASAERDAAVARVTADAQATADTLRAEIAERVTENTTTLAALAEARAETESLRAALENVEALLSTARTELIESKRVLTETEMARQSALATHTEILAARDVEIAARVTAETELAELREVIVEHERARVEIEARMDALAARDGVAASLLEDLVSGFGTLATASTIPDILTTLVEQMAAEFPRVALFRPKANRLEGQHQIGFDLSNDITKVVMPLTLDSLLTRAASSGKLESASGGEMVERSHVPFGGSPMCAVAMPLVVQGETLGVVYADDFGGERQDSASDRAARIKYCEVMQQHAVALLMRLTNELKTLAELRAYAGSLLKEIEEMYAADEGAGRPADELRRRLQANVEYARSIFATRVSLECPEAAGLLEEQIAAAAAREDGGAFIRDLAATAGVATSDRKRA